MIAVFENNQVPQELIFRLVMHSSRRYSNIIGLEAEKMKVDHLKNKFGPTLLNNSNDLESLNDRLKANAAQNLSFLYEKKIKQTSLYAKRCEAIIKLFSTEETNLETCEQLFEVLLSEAKLSAQIMLGLESARMQVHNQAKEYLRKLCKEGFKEDEPDFYKRKSTLNEEKALQSLMFTNLERYTNGISSADECFKEFIPDIRKFHLSDEQKRDVQTFWSTLNGSASIFPNEEKTQEDFINKPDTVLLPIKVFNRVEENHINEKINRYRKYNEELENAFDPSCLNQRVIPLDVLLSTDATKVLESLTQLKMTNDNLYPTLNQANANKAK